MENGELRLQEIQRASLEILKDVDVFCRNNSIKYFVFFGTLIGAVRHKGFIPWDDDVDIAMLREDYDKFIDEYGEKGKYRIINYTNESSSPYMISRVSDDTYSLKSDYGPEYRIGAFIDIYPMDGLGNNFSEIRKYMKLSKRFSRGLGKSLERNVFGAVKETHNGIKKWLLLATYIVPKIKGACYYRNKLIELHKMSIKIEESKYVGCIIWNLVEKECYEKKWLEGTCDLDFEEIKVCAPKQYDTILRHNYGDYMELPPERERIAHHYYSIYKQE